MSAALLIAGVAVAAAFGDAWAAPQGASPAAPGTAKPDRSWIQRSNDFTELLLDVTKKHSPEAASAQGLAQYDEQVSQPTKQDDDASVAETKAVQIKLTRALAIEHDKNVQEDLSILLHSIELSLKTHDFTEAHEVPYDNASQDVFQGLRGLLDDQVAPERRKAALVRLRKYAGVEPGYKPLTEILKQRALELWSRSPSRT